MIKINLYDYQRIAQEVTIQKMVMTAVFIVIAAIGLTGLSYVSDTVRVGGAESEMMASQQKVNQIKPQYDSVQALKAREGAIQGKIKGLEGLRTAKVPFARLLEDVGRIAPEGVWLEKVEQQKESKVRSDRVPILFLDSQPAAPARKPKRAAPAAKEAKPPEEHLFIKLQGKARSDRGVVRFMEGLESLDYLDHVILHKSNISWVEKREVRVYTVFAHVAGSGPQPGS